MTLTQRLFLLVVAALLPAIAIQAYNELDLRRTRETEVRSLALNQAMQATAELDRILEGVRILLTAVAEVPAIRAFDTAACSAYLTALQVKVSYLLTISAIDLEGNVSCRPTTAPVDTRIDTRAYEEALTSGGFVVGQYTDRWVAGRPVLPLALAIRNEGGGRAIGVVEAALDLDWLTDRLREHGLSEGGSVTVADRDGVIIAREPQRKDFIGTRIPDAYRFLVDAPRPGAIELTSQDGTRRIVGYVPVSLPPVGVYVSAGLSTEVAFAAIDRATRRGIGLIVGGTLLALTAAWVVGRLFLRRPLARLLAVAKAWREGDYAVRTGMSTREGEFGALGEAFDQMVDAVVARRVAQERAADVLREREERLRVTYEQAPVGIDETDLDGRFVAVNARYCEITGYSRESLLGQHFAFVTHPDDIAADRDHYRRLLAGEIQDYHLEKRYIRRDGRLVWVDLVSTLVRDGEGRPSRGIAIVQDITERKEAEEALRRSESHLRLATMAGGFGTWAMDIVRDEGTWSDRATEIFGVAPTGGVTGFADWQAIVHPEDREQAVADFAAAIAGDGEYRSEYRIRDAERVERWIAVQGLVSRDAQGHAIAVVGVVRDITERKSTETRQKLLIDELNHRVKNTLMVVQSIARQSNVSAAPAEFIASFTARLMSLSRAHDVLSREGWRGASLAELVETTLAPYRIEGRDRFTFDGPPLRLQPNAAVTLGMVLHELAANAAKHGSLSIPGGAIYVQWRHEVSADWPVEIAWRDRGGPPVAEPLQRGFGLRLIERGLAQQFGATVELTFQHAGLECRIRLPRTGVLSEE